MDTTKNAESCVTEQAASHLKITKLVHVAPLLCVPHRLGNAL
jgi:hypothetical protein